VLVPSRCRCCGGELELDCDPEYPEPCEHCRLANELLDELEARQADQDAYDMHADAHADACEEDR